MSLLKLIISGLSYIFLAYIFSFRSQLSLVNRTFLGKIFEKNWLGAWNLWSEQPLAPPSEDVITVLEILVDPM